MKTICGCLNTGTNDEYHVFSEKPDPKCASQFGQWIGGLSMHENTFVNLFGFALKPGECVEIITCKGEIVENIGLSE